MARYTCFACGPELALGALLPRVLGAAGGELVLKGEEVEEVEGAAPVEVGGGVAGGEEGLEGEEVEEGEFAVAIEVNAAEEAAEVEDVGSASLGGAANGLLRSADNDAGAIGGNGRTEQRGGAHLWEERRRLAP